MNFPQSNTARSSRPLLVDHLCRPGAVERYPDNGQFRPASFILLLVLGCSSPSTRGEQGPAGPTGPQGPQGIQGPAGTANTGISCTANANFCDGSTLYRCTKSGADATLIQDCTGGSANNPMSCTVAGCVLAKPTCSYALSAPSLSGSGPECFPPLDCTDSDLIAELVLNSTVCPGVNSQVTITLHRASISPGQTVTLPSAGASLQFYQSSNGTTTTCFSWTGSVTWDRDVPSWKTTINATCSEPGKGSVKVIGYFQGDM